MARIFFALALLAVLLLVANAALGIWMGPYNESWGQRQAAQQTLVEKETLLAAEQGDTGLQAARDQFQRADERFREVQKSKTIHFMLGLVASLVTVLVNSITVTYFVGTSRWCREVVDTYQLDIALAQRSAALKRKTFPWALVGISAILAVVVLGAMADPAANTKTSADWASTHFIGAILAIGVVGWAFLAQVKNIGANFQTIAEIVDEVRRVRQERGLDNDPPLQENG